MQLLAQKLDKVEQRCDCNDPHCCNSGKVEQQCRRYQCLSKLGHIEQEEDGSYAGHRSGLDLDIEHKSRHSHSYLSAPGNIRESLYVPITDKTSKGHTLPPQAHLQTKDITTPKYELSLRYLGTMGTSCQNCNKLTASLIEFNSVLLCPACFDKEIQRLSTTIIEP